MDKNIKVSVILPSLNVAQYMKACLDSVVNQTLKNIEIICVDAGSTDGTLEIIQDFCRKDSRVQLIISDKKSYGYQMNLGLDSAKGKYMGIVETDDMVPKEMFECLYELAEDNNVDFIKADFYRFTVNKDGSLNLNYNRLSPQEKYYNTVLKPSENKEVFKFIMNTWSGIYNVDFLRKWNIRHNETPGASYQDNGFWFQTFARAERVYFLDKALYLNRRDNPNSSVFSKNKVYCMRDEYDYIRLIIDNDLENLKEFIPLCNYFRFCGYYYNTINRVAPEFRKEFLTYFSNEFKQLIDKNEISRELFTNKEWNDLLLIVYTPEFFFDEVFSLIDNLYDRELTYESSSDEDPMFSIIVPIYNVEDYLAECLESILHQTYDNYEVICINDGSTDSSQNIVETYMKKDSRIRLYSQNNMGLSAARNTGLIHAKGKYICFLDSDDGLSQNALEKLYNEVQNHESDIIIFGFETNYYPVFDEVPAWLADKNPIRNIVYPSFTAEMMFNEKGAKPLACRNCYSRELLAKNNFFFLESCKFGEDTIFQMMVFPKAKNITFIQDKLYYYRCSRPNSLMMNNNNRLYDKCKSHIEIVSFLTYLYREYGILNNMRPQFAAWAIDFILNEYNLLKDAQKEILAKDIYYLVHKIIDGNIDKYLGPGNKKRMKELESLYKEGIELSNNNFISIKDAFESPKISIIVPCYNMEQHIEKCLNSLLNQTMEEIQVICINDASTDNTFEIINRISSIDKRLSVINYTENKTANQARKDGVLIASGEYILFCDADDTLMLDACEKLYSEMRTAPVDILHFSTNIVDCGGLKEDITWFENNLSPFYGSLFKKGVFEGCFRRELFGATLWNKMYSSKLAKKAFEQIEDGKFPRGQDLYAFVLLAYFAESYRGILDSPLYNYHFGNGEDGKKELSVLSFEKFCSFSYVIAALERFFDKENISQTYDDVLMKLKSRMIGDCINKWTNQVLDTNKGKCLDLLFLSWENWRIVESVARRYWNKQGDLSKILSSSKLNSVTKSSISTIAMYYHKLNGGGAEKVIIELTNLFLKMGYKVVLITDINDDKDYIDLPANVVRYSIPNQGIGNPNDYFKRAKRLSEIIEIEQIDTMIYHAWNTGLLLWDMLLAKAANVPFLIHCHSIFSIRLLDNSDYFANMPWIFSLADGIICLSEVDKEYWSLFNSKVYCVQNPFTYDIDQIESSKLDNYNILWIGRFSPEKRPIDALHIFSIVCEKIPSARLQVLGTSNKYEDILQLKQTVEKLKISSNVEFCGFQKDISSYMKNASLIITTSEFEGYPLTILEAKTFGLPIVMYELPYLTICQGNRGIISVPTGDVIMAGEAAINVLTNETLRKSLGTESRLHALELASYNYIEVWQKIFDGISVNKTETFSSPSQKLMFETLLNHYKLGVDKARSNQTNTKTKESIFGNNKQVEVERVKFYKKEESLIKRKARGLVQCYKEHGMKYTIKRIHLHCYKGVRLAKKTVRYFKKNGFEKTISKVKEKLS